MQHPDITMIERTGYPSLYQEDEADIYCCECGGRIHDEDEVYECKTHATLCEDCLKMLHRKRW